jgi:hypothetical protein
MMHRHLHLEVIDARGVDLLRLLWLRTVVRGIGVLDGGNSIPPGVVLH